MFGYKQEPRRMNGISYRGNPICFGKYETLESVCIRSMVPFSGYKKRKKSRIQVGDHFENYSDNFKKKKVLHDVARINAFLEKKISDLKHLIEHLVEEAVIPYYLATEAAHSILIFLDFFLQDYMKVKNHPSSEKRKEAKRQALRQAQSHPETKFLYYVKIPFFYIKPTNENAETFFYIKPTNENAETDFHAETDFRNSVKILFYSLTNDPHMKRFVNWKISWLGPAHLLDHYLVESGIEDLLDYILRDAIDINIFIEDSDSEEDRDYDEDRDSDVYINCRVILRASVFQFVDHFFQDFMKLKNPLSSERDDKDEKKGND